MSDFTDAYVDLLIKQYWEKPNARAEIAALAGTMEKIRDLYAAFGDAFDVDLAVGAQLDVIGKIAGVPRIIPSVLPKTAFGFAENSNATGFDDKFEVIADVAPFLDKFEESRTTLELDDNDYRFFIKAKIAANVASGFIVTDERISLQEAIQRVFDNQAYVLDEQDMTLTLYVFPAFNPDRLLIIQELDLLPKPQGVRYDIIIQAAPGETFGFADNPDALGFADKFDSSQEGGRFALKVL